MEQISAIPPDNASRRTLMAVLAQATSEEIRTGLGSLGPLPAHTELRPAETGLVMLRGRIGGDGAPFNVGEATVTRAAVQVPSGEIGFSYVLGRDREQARLAALVDALWQNERSRADIECNVVAPIRQRIERERQKSQEETAATRVDFFTLVRGENE